MVSVSRIWVWATEGVGNPTKSSELTSNSAPLISINHDPIGYKSNDKAEKLLDSLDEAEQLLS